MGINAISLGLVGLLAGIFDKNFSKDSRITVMLMVFGMTILFEILNYIVSGIILHTSVEILNFIRILVIEVIYNLIITIIIYPIMQRFGYYIENKYKKNKGDCRAYI